MTNFYVPINYEDSSIPKLQKFLATNYDITDLAAKISATKYLKLNTLNLRKNNANIE